MSTPDKSCLPQLTCPTDIVQVGSNKGKSHKGLSHNNHHHHNNHNHITTTTITATITVIVIATGLAVPLALWPVRSGIARKPVWGLLDLEIILASSVKSTARA